MSDAPEWPLNIPHKLSPEEEAYYEDLVTKLEHGKLEFRPLTPEEHLQHKRMLENPVTTSISRPTEDTFEVRMYCYGCDVEDTFDQTAPEPWAERRDRFETVHKNHRRKKKET